MRVDLPAPFSPSSAWTSPGRTSNDTPESARTPGNDLLDAAHLEQRSRGSVGRSGGLLLCAHAASVTAGHAGRRHEVGNREKTLRGEQIAEDLDALSLAHNLVVPPILVVAAFSATRL